MNRTNITLVAMSICIVFAVGCSAPKPVKLDGTDRVPVNKVGAEKEWKEGEQRK